VTRRTLRVCACLISRRAGPNHKRPGGAAVKKEIRLVFVQVFSKPRFSLPQGKIRCIRIEVFKFLGPKLEWMVQICGNGVRVIRWRRLRYGCPQ